MAREIINSPAPPMLISAAITEMANHAGNEPWPSLEAASRWFDRASIVLSLLAGFAATVVIVWLGIAKEHHWDLLRDSSNEKVATLELRPQRQMRRSGLRRPTSPRPTP